MSDTKSLLHRQEMKITGDIFSPYEKAALLLRDENLVWDDDFNAIREPLAVVLHECATTKNLNPYLLEVAFKLIDTTKSNA